MADDDSNMDSVEKRTTPHGHLKRESEICESKPVNQGDEREEKNQKILFCEPQPTTFPLMTKVRECDWSQFKNVFADEPLCVIDALVAGPNLNLQVLDESVRRQPPNDSKWTRNPLHYRKWIPSQRKWIQRIRIRSAAVLRTLNEVTGDTWDTSRAHTFMKPFGYLIFHHEAIKKRLATLELELSQHIPQSTSEATPTSDVEEIRCYTNFVQCSLLPLYKQFEDEKDGSRKTRFDDLWYLFRPGEIIYAQPKETNSFETLWGRESYKIGAMKEVWRVADIRPHEGRLRYDKVFSESGCPSDGSDSEEDQDSNALGVLCFSEPRSTRRTVGWFTLRCYYIDFDGEHYFPVWRTIAIPPFTGERSISSLGVYPLRFAKDSVTVYGNMESQGKRFVDCVLRKHLWHSGWFLMAEPDGRVMLTFKGEPINDTADYTGEVYVDVKEAMSDRVQWRARTHSCKPYQVSSRTFIESFPVVTWDTTDRNRVALSPYEIVVLNDDIHRFQFNEYLSRDRYISQPNGVDAGEFPLKEDDFALLPRRLYVYLLRYHYCIPVDVNNLQPISPQPKAFDEVVFKEKSEVKDRLNALLDAYFERKKLIEDTSTLAADALAADDFVCGKASGLVILLQGAPGTGKTATVEAIAQSRGKPLLVVSPDDADDDLKLNIIFRVATKWNCIVLMDEVDVLLSRRNYHDLPGNIWVSKLLRYLETFSGVLFLTTMRAGAFDEGVKSRVHLSICYQPLDESQTIEIFKIHLKRLKRFEELQHQASAAYRPVAIDEDDILKFASEHFQKHSVKLGLGRWNGRQIRNAIRVAAAICHYYYRDKPNLQPQLRGEHFRKVAQLTEEYDDIRYKTLGFTDGGYARSARERFDIDTERAARPPRRKTKNAGLGADRRPQSAGEKIMSYNNDDKDDDDDDGDADTRREIKYRPSDPIEIERKDRRDPRAYDGGSYQRVSGFDAPPQNSFDLGSSGAMMKDKYWNRRD